MEFAGTPDADLYLDAVAASIDALTHSCRALVVSLGYDTVAGDPHGSWSLPPAIFASIGRLLAASGLPVCVIQEGGYALRTLATCSDAFATGLLVEGGVGGRERASAGRRHVTAARRVRSVRLEGSPT